MSKRLPSLNALRVFVAVARSGGVSRAAEELNLTHSAVSHQIRSLQSELGVTLFEKSGRGLMLTEQARAYVQRIESAFKEIEEATLDVTTHNRHRLRISTIPSFAARWLLPRRRLRPEADRLGQPRALAGAPRRAAAARIP